MSSSVLKGLRDVVVGADAQAGDLVGDVLLRGQDDDGQGPELRISADFGQKIDAVAVGEVSVEQHKLGRLFFRRARAFAKESTVWAS